MAMCMAVAVHAQDWYLGGNISWSHSMSENMLSTDFIFGEIPGVNINVGDNFTRFGGMRMSLGFNPQVGRPGMAQSDALPDIFKRYHFNTASAYLDGVINLTEIILPRNIYRTASLSAIIGVGTVYNWGLDSRVQAEEWMSYYPVDYYRGDDDKLIALNAFNKFYPVVHIGGVGVLKLSKTIDFSMEAKYTIISDKYNGVLHGGPCDGFLDFNVGIVYYFGKKHRERPEIQNLRHYTIDQNERLETEFYTKGGRMATGVSFYIDRTNITPQQRENLKHVANFLAQRSTVNIIIHGYCDTKKGNEEHNQRLAETRVKEVYNLLTTIYRINPERITTQVHVEPLPQKEDAGEWIRAVEFEMQ